MIKWNEAKSKFEYYDRFGQEINEGDYITYDDELYRKVYLIDAEENVLGTDATNHNWVKTGRAVPCEYGCYQLTNDDTEWCTVCRVEREESPSGMVWEMMVCKHNGEWQYTHNIITDDECCTDESISGIEPQEQPQTQERAYRIKESEVSEVWTILRDCKNYLKDNGQKGRAEEMQKAMRILLDVVSK